MVMICSLAGCASSRVYKDEEKTLFSNSFVVIKESDEGLCKPTVYHIYDKNTKIVYIYTLEGYHATMCPYYVVVDGIPQAAIYGETYK